MPRVPIQQPNDIVIKVREACGGGMTRVNGVCKNARPACGQQV
jgi:hypothetical protein